MNLCIMRKFEPSNASELSGQQKISSKLAELVASQRKVEPEW